MSRKQVGSLIVVGLVAVATGFTLMGQIKAQLLTPSNQIARNQALVRSVQDLEKTNETYRAAIASQRAQIAALESDAARRSASTQALASQVADLRAHAGLTPLHGPGVEIDLANGVPAPDLSGQPGYVVSYTDVQDVVNLLFAQGAEGVAVSGRRITPVSAFSGSGGDVVIDQGPPLTSPIKIMAVGDRNRMEAALGDPSVLPDLRSQQVRYQLQFSFIGAPDVSLPAYDSSLEIPYVLPF